MATADTIQDLVKTGIYSPAFEKENCGFGLIAHMDGAHSHWVVETAIASLARLTHRGAISADGLTGDGCGLLMQKPKQFFIKEAKSHGFTLKEQFAVGVVFLSQNPEQEKFARQTILDSLKTENLEFAGWRQVPIDASVLGKEASLSLPVIEHVFVNPAQGMDQATFDRHLYIARRRAEKIIEKTNDEFFYIPSFSSQVLSYKGLVMPATLPRFYLDLQNNELSTGMAVFHQRFSTNTWPQWRLAQPFRYLAHNGEINTIQGNRNWSVARGHKFETPLIPDIDAIRPLVSMSGSDSNSLDNMLEALLAGGMDIFRAMRLLIPPAWQNIDNLKPELRAFYEYNSMHMEPWDGPAGVVITDGRYAACTLDRNGLRPARYVITENKQGKDGLTNCKYSDCVITLASETGVYDYREQDVVAKGRLKPGQMLAADTHTGELLLPEDVDQHLMSRFNYKSWMKSGANYLESSLAPNAINIGQMSDEQYLIYEKQFQLSNEEKEYVIKVLAEQGQEAVGSMGDDTPMAVLSQQVRPLYDYFRQQFAQVTNPPIDSLRENIVMSLETCLGSEQNLFEEKPEYAHRLLVETPVLSSSKCDQLLALKDPRYRVQEIDLNYEPHHSLRDAVQNICDQAVAAVRSGVVFLLLSDKNIQKDKLVIHALLATGAVHHRLIAEGLRCDANIVVKTGTARDPHQIATLIGYGATCVYPYMAYESIHKMVQSGEIDTDNAGLIMKSYRKGINKGLYKVMSKMGISSIASYRGAQLFEAIGINSEVINNCFKGTTSRISGAGFEHFEEDTRILNQVAWNPRKQIYHGGIYRFVQGGEFHAYNPDVVGFLQKAVKTGDYSVYRQYADSVNHSPVTYLRDLMQLKIEAEQSISIDQVEPAEAIYKRFDSAAMSMGALSKEAHETLAQAMNRLGARSNSGEGGEDPARYNTDKVSKIKQIASGRFGVTPHYLVNAEVLQIKVAQGAKPGEGGQLPGHKVDINIAKQRYSVPGVTLISPPPHHDIYSIEDLAQLIFDLKQINPDALVSVKLVSEPGVGTIAAGVAKAYADLITISGYDGGTGASPLTSVKYAGSPWELGLSETQQVMRANDLRGKIRLQTDGGLKTGLDVVKAAILGAESFAFGTGPMIAMGCKYLRICHLNNCATGVATQNVQLREQHFIGQVEMVMNYFHFIAQDIREILASLGLTKLEDAIGRTDLLQRIEGKTHKQEALDLSALVNTIDNDSDRFCVSAKNEPFDKGELAETMVKDLLPAIENCHGGIYHYDVRNTDRSIGARLSGEIAKRYGNLEMEKNPITIMLKGSAGQSLGVWNAGGLHLKLTGDANDYVGKGMTGGSIMVKPAKDVSFNSQDAAIIGNTCLYGATGGNLFAAGRAGERFAVRNSGAFAVVEGIGDHGCEYMTGGVVIVLGETGVNFGAGMTGGFAFVLDINNEFVDRYNHELIEINRISSEPMEAYRHYLRDKLQLYIAETESTWGQHIMDNFSAMIGKFWLVKPKAASLEQLLETLSVDAA